MQREKVNRLRRALALRYPFLPYRGRIPLLQGATADIPAGAVVETRHGMQVRVWPDWMYHDVYYWGDYEPYHTKIFSSIVHPGRTVFDVGANFGWFTTLFARWVGERGRVHSFEPVPFIYDLTKETVAMNGMHARVELNRLALGRSPGTLTIRTYAGLPHGHATAADLHRDDSTEHMCAVTSLDRYCEDHAVDGIDFMKVDVEGFEPDVFAGGENTLALPTAPIIAFEVNGECLRARSLRSSDVIGELRGLGYTNFFSFSTRSGVHRLRSDDVDHGDCIAVKPHHLDRLEDALKTSRVFR